MIPNFASVFTNNLALKLLAILLGLVVYAYVYTEQEHETMIRAPVRVIGLPSDLVLTDPPPEYAVLNARGKGKQLLKLRLESPEIVVDLSEARAGRVQRMLSPTDAALPVGTEVNITEIVEPRMVEFSIDTLLEREVDVDLVVGGELPEQFGLSAPIEVEPMQVRVRGPSVALEHMTRIATRMVDLSSLRDSTELEVELDPGDLVEISPGSVMVWVPVVPLVNREFVITPVRVVGLETGLAAAVEPDTAYVILTGSEDAFQALDLDGEVAEVAVFLNGEGLAPGRHLLTPRVLLPDPSTLRVVSIRPARFMAGVGVSP
jgi:YbbR domain-containing protein